MDGVVLVAGVFQPGSVVTLSQVEDEAVLRPEAHQAVGRRLVDENGNVGFDGLEVGARYFASGYVNGVYVLVRLIGVEAGAPSSELQQAPIAASPQPVGTQEKVQPDPAPAAPSTPLPVGVPAAADPADSSTEVEGWDPGAEAGRVFYLPPEGLEDWDVDAWRLSGRQTVPRLVEEGGEQVTVEPALLYEFIANPEDVTPGAGWTVYHGVTELVPAAAGESDVPPAVTPDPAAGSAPEGAEARAGDPAPAADPAAAAADPAPAATDGAPAADPPAADGAPASATPPATDGASAAAAGGATDGASPADPSADPAPPATPESPAQAGGSTTPVA
jgi:hypothetical protein